MTRTPPSAFPPSRPGGDGRRPGTTAETGTAPEIAREALRQLAAQRVPPTPDNYRAFYHQIAGTAPEEVFPTRALKAIAGALPRSTPEAVRLARQFEEAVAAGQWPALKLAIVAICETRGEAQLAWGLLIRDLVGQLERNQQGFTRARKLESLQHVLASSSADPAQLHMRLQGLLRSWGQAAEGEEEALPGGQAEQPAPAPDTAAPVVAPRAAIEVIGELLARVLTRGVAPVVAHEAELSAEVAVLAAEATSLADEGSALRYRERLDNFAARLAWYGDDQHAVRDALLTLLRLLVDNIRELVLDDNWLHGQLSVLAEAFTGELDIRMLDEVERRLRDVIDKQSHLKRQLSDAQQRLKTMLAGFIDRLASFSNTTGEFHDVLDQCATRISAAHDISELSDVVEQMLRETRNTQESARRSGEELAELREQVESANQHILRLQRELDETSELVRHDPLTGALNRKGLDEALAREIARARRHGSPLCLALLDVDNFKQLNDTYGHRAGDDALRHLFSVIREAVRPQDAVGRYGGEEFLIVLPDTDTEQAAAVVVRLQRELTRRFFLANSQKLLITFSAGIARLHADEDPQLAIDRADKAMYAAKRAGKNRVLIAA
ncbi:diguanylate cyclase [Azoarcus olearius]|uniref:GGDEF domain-containing protein n=1 Tax=Azoarcus sp. (strain BH72) TaxID=418699 RepID=UPI00080623D2|nr:GGDEF domain-containing protein [Azoarcus olearius]ANQ85854.1 diguanylate cyclase [Azoarcus olearius]